MASFDIEYLYTNIPLKETIAICINAVFENCNFILNFDKKQFKLLLELITNNTHFIFDNKIYQRTEGIALGSPIAPNLANIFLCHQETKWLKDCPLTLPHSFIDAIWMTL